MILRGLIFAAAVVGLSAPISAVRAEEPDRADIVQMYRFGHCIVSQNSRNARKVLADNYGEEAFGDALMTFGKGHSRCLSPGTLEISGILFAGTLAELLLRRDFDQDQLTARLHPTQDTLKARDTGEYTALCMAVSYPAETSGLIFSTVNSDEADAALAEYVRVLPSCVREGQELRANRVGLRAIAALAAYRIAQENISGASE